MCLLLCANWGCTKFSAECDYVIMPQRMLVESSPKDQPAWLTRVYVFYLAENETGEKATPNPWAPSSWADADAGIVRNGNTGEVRLSSYVVEQGGDNYIHAVVSSSPVMLVVVNAYDKMYAWGTYKYEIPMPEVRLPLQFDIWKKGDESVTSYGNMRWTVSW